MPASGANRGSINNPFRIVDSDEEDNHHEVIDLTSELEIPLSDIEDQDSGDLDPEGQIIGGQNADDQDDLDFDKPLPSTEAALRGEDKRPQSPRASPSTEGHQRTQVSLKKSVPSLPSDSGNEDLKFVRALPSPQRDTPERAEQSGYVEVHMNISAVKKAMESILAEMKSEHADAVFSLLQNANLQDMSSYIDPEDYDDVSPFARMKAFEGHPDSQVALTVKSYVGKKFTQTSFTVKTVGNTVEPAPRYRFFTNIPRSVLVEDRQLSFTPYINSTYVEPEAEGEDWETDLKTAYEGRIKDINLSKRFEKILRIKPYLTKVFEDCEISRPALTNAILQSPPHPETDDFNYFLSTFENVFGIPLPELLPELNEIDFTTSNKNPMPVPDIAGKVLSTYMDLGCLVCGAFECKTHGEISYEEEETKGKLDHFVLPYKVVQAVHGERIARQKLSETQILHQSQLSEDDEPCGETCFILPITSSYAEDESNDWTEDESAIIHESLLAIQTHPRAACIISQGFSKIRSCREVHRFITKIVATPKVHKQKLSDDDHRTLKWWDKERRRLVGDEWKRNTNTHLHEKRERPSPCDHEGLSCHDAGCSCFQENVLCEQWCTCPDSCYRKYNGCECKDRCLQSTCICRKLNRECDPDLCRGCEAIISARQGPTDAQDTCSNCEIQRGIGKRVVVGESSIKGFGYGLFLAEDASPGDFIAEYIGELISHEESDRRSHVYDRLKISYLFTLNESLIIDSYHKGNVTRFINHSVRAKNIEARVPLVNYEHRIGFFATEYISAGSELFFDYGADFVKKFKLREAGNEGHRGSRNVRGKGRGRERAGKGVARSKHPLNSALNTADDTDDNTTIDGDEFEALRASVPMDESSGDEYMDSGAGLGLRTSQRQRRPNQKYSR